MFKRLLKILFVSFLISCGSSEEYRLELFVSGAQIAGVNGMHFGPDGYLYAASVIGSDISVIDTESKVILKRFGLSLSLIHI